MLSVAIENGENLSTIKLEEGEIGELFTKINHLEATYVSFIKIECWFAGSNSFYLLGIFSEQLAASAASWELRVEILKIEEGDKRWQEEEETYQADEEDEVGCMSGEKEDCRKGSGWQTLAL